MSPVIAVDRKAAKPLHKQIYDAYRDLIVSRILGAGQQIPSTRAQASELKISRIPVLTAYAQLLAEGYFEARVGAGTFVCGSLPEQLTFHDSDNHHSNQVRSGYRAVAKRALLLPRYETPPWIRGVGPFSVSQAAYDQFPFQIWSNLVMRHCRNPHAGELHYGLAMGFEGLRDAICTYLRTSRAVRCEPNVRVTAPPPGCLAAHPSVTHPGPTPDRDWRDARKVPSAEPARHPPVDSSVHRNRKAINREQQLARGRLPKPKSASEQRQRNYLASPVARRGPRGTEVGRKPANPAD